MSFIFTTLLFISFLSFIALSCISYILNKNPQLTKKKHRFFLVCLVLIGVRLFLPLDFPNVQIIRVKEILPEIFLFLYNPLFTLFKKGISIFNTFSFIWIIGTVFFTAKLILSYYATVKYMRKLTPYKNGKVRDILQVVKKQYTREISFRLVADEELATPIIFGICKPYIVIPNISLTDDEWYYIIAHEVAHYYQGHMYLKLLFELFHALYWWNPLFYVLKKQISILLEINIDIKISKQLQEIDRLSYLECLLNMAKRREIEKSKRFSAAFAGDKSSLISRRIKILMSNPAMFKSKVSFKLNSLITAVLTICVLIIPNFYTIVPSKIVSKEMILDMEDTFVITSDNAFFIRLENDTYDLYTDGIFLLNTRYTEIFGEDIKIYEDIQEVKLDDYKK